MLLPGRLECHAKRYIKTITDVQLIESRIQQHFTPSRQRLLALSLAWLFSLIAIWWLAQLTWRVLTPAEQVVVAPIALQQRVGNVEGDALVAVQQLYLFGDRVAAAEADAEVLDAPETTLNVRLVGLVASVDPERSAAIIEQSGTQRTYIIGERIGNSRATLDAVFPDRVILDNGGRREALYIEGRDGSEAQLRMPASPAAQVNQSENESTRSEQVDLSANQELLEAVSNVRENPSELLEIINVSPVRNGQQLTGYRLSPRQNRALFDALGLQPGDIALAINGFDLTEPSEALAAMNELQDATRAIVQVQRGNNIIDLELQVP
ncbi:type II secretion system protein GspC [Aliidiomarina sedimenti]|uniref:Type II secretion system protein GspC n=1 Tax=Aliidiomarina sedimenti TaxID=1933879 RepID=A0ABY0BYK3_9GAMM|nr:type II secretion system protein GspC [Aliidiomarina sedimenti]